MLVKINIQSCEQVGYTQKQQPAEGHYEEGPFQQDVNETLASLILTTPSRSFLFSPSPNPLMYGPPVVERCDESSRFGSLGGEVFRGRRILGSRESSGKLSEVVLDHEVIIEIRKKGEVECGGGVGSRAVGLFLDVSHEERKSVRSLKRW